MTSKALAPFALIALCSIGCAGGPTMRPAKGGAVNAGPGSVEAERRRLAGTWVLSSYTLFDEAGKATKLAGSARLTYEEFGNLTMTGEVHDNSGARPEASALLNYNGRIVIDPDLHEFRMLDLTGTGDIPHQIDLAAARQYQIQGDRLEITVKSAAGRTVAVVSWTRSKA
jgi:hypothetical protein